MASRSEAVARAEAYYDSAEADAFYKNFWGGEDIHVGIYDTPDEDIAPASRRTVSRMADCLQPAASSRMLDVGAGYGGAARQLVEQFDGLHVTCLNLSETQNALNRSRNAEEGLGERISVIHGDFEAIPEPDAQFDLVWSQDAILHSGNRNRVLSEITRVMQPGGELIFTDPMQADDAAQAGLQPILDRLQLDSLASVRFYREALSGLGFEEVSVTMLTEHMQTHYRRVGEELRSRYDTAVSLSGADYVDRMLVGLDHWVDGAARGDLAWAIMHFRKSAE